MSEIEGNMAYAAESSDSESESGEELHFKEGSIAEPTISIKFGEDDEEEVEYFGGKKAPVTIDNNNNAHAESKLASLLFQKPAESAGPVAEGVKDEFGIEYHSRRKPQGTNLPSALDDFDEEIVNRMILAPSNTLPTTEEDDEFDIEVDDIAPSQNAELIAKALQNASVQAQSPDVESAAPTFAPTSVSAAADIAIASSPDAAGGSKTSAVTSIMEEARKALAEVAEVYGNGLGDQEVLQLSGGSTTTNSAPAANTNTRLCDAIEEGDEEEEEQQEIEEEQRKEEYLRMQQTQKQQLESEWDTLQRADSTGSQLLGHNETAFDSNGEPVRVVSMKDMAKVWTFDEAVVHFQDMDHSQRLPLIVTHEETKGGWFSTAPKPLSYEGSVEDLNLPFLIAQVDYDPQCTSHWQMLSTLYSFFIRGVGDSELTLTTTSRNWERLGFQGSDPRTDLNRSMKMLSVLQMLSFIELDRAGAMRAFELSMSNCIPEPGAAPTSVAERNARAANDSSWPFMCVAIMFTKESLQALRKGVFNEKIMKRQSVFSVLNEYHRACFAEFERMLLLEPHKHHAVHLASLRKLCESGPLKLLKRHKSSAPSSPSKAPRSPVRAPAPAAAPAPTVVKAAPTVVKAAPPATEEFHFDELGALEDKTDAEEEAEPAVSSAGGKSTWSSSIFGSKASKFAL